MLEIKGRMVARGLRGIRDHKEMLVIKALKDFRGLMGLGRRVHKGIKDQTATRARMETRVQQETRGLLGTRAL